MLRPSLKPASIKRLVWFGALLAVAAIGVVVGDLRRRAEPFIGRYVADIFVFSILRNDPHDHGPSLAAADMANRGPSERP